MVVEDMGIHRAGSRLVLCLSVSDLWMLQPRQGQSLVAGEAVGAARFGCREAAAGRSRSLVKESHSRSGSAVSRHRYARGGLLLVIPGVLAGIGVGCRNQAVMVVLLVGRLRMTVILTWTCCNQ